VAKHRRRPPRPNGTGRHRAASGGLTRAIKRAVVLVMAFAIAATVWVFLNNELALRNGTQPFDVGLPQPTSLPPTEVPAPVPLGPAVQPPPTSVPVKPDVAPNTGGGPELEPRSGSAHRPAAAPPPFNRDCLILNLGNDVAPPVRDVACFLNEQFDEINLIAGVGPRAKDGSGHEDGLAVDLFVQDARTIEEIKDCAARRFRDWNLRNVIHGDQILVETGGEFRPMQGREDPGGPDYIHIALKDESAIARYSLVC
jgi:hypothetical protein